MIEVSVIIPTYSERRIAFLKRAVGSVIIQSFDDLEIIVVNGNPLESRATAKIHEAFDSSPVKVVDFFKKRPDGKPTPSAQRNVGLRLARGKYVAFLDDDDFWVWNKLEEQVSTLEEGDYSIVSSLIRYVFPRRDGTFVPFGVRKTGKEIITLGDELRHNFLPTSTILMRRKLILSVGGFDESMHVNEDWDLWIRAMLFSGKPAYVIQKPLVDYTVHGSTSSNLRLMLEYTRKIYEKHGRLYERHPEAEVWVGFKLLYLDFLEGDVRNILSDAGLLLRKKTIGELEGIVRFLFDQWKLMRKRKRASKRYVG